ncbi:hypothetical protein HY449_01055 [Candidatus Pacearchaeota archaeon]|nr:hypothetical protein [Candidatus Pacearchaeota archaeon]
MEIEKQLKNALEELRKEPGRKFEQTVDLIINLQKFDLKKNQVNIFVNVPHKIKEKKIAAFLEVKNSNVETITKNDFKKYSDKKEIKKLVGKFDFFIAQASLMPSVATAFGRVLGPAGKMPSPQLGILMNPDDKSIKELKDKINQSVRIRAKESSIKIPIGKEKMKDEDIIENITVVYNALLKSLPKEKDNVKNIEIKFTMSKPAKVSVK